ncbi:MAG: hypothetical protein A3J46_00370 [Candidatus Yanofskybacteria bacterium RIFCSPHIGHO2_02_FULL_41_11]|uniref:Lycopene cyclase domain-containing protein n=1 Tax=Candidatus Yanofskybacteria bacterium RIFCSPHIGHO2_02_FULL_41_11 TaxID=1802675 RepID=A0A1F8F9H1_9BACT|nr:MAG: hypothetical protein A3J46_00370 [Candidatus Yanofskybacteria bacterium RIFCSPHIGHO2_02_FULL_41_11]
MTITSQFTSVGELTVPGYWHPPTLFNLGFITGGLSIEDALFSFLVGGIATVIYEVVFNSSIKLKVHHRHHLGAFLFGFIFSAAFAFIYKPNPIYALIAFGLSGAIFLCVVRRDLILHSLFGGVLFMLLYFFNFLIFNSWFPYFVDSYYNLKNISGIMVLSVPFEELLYALSFGMLWAPVYEYEHGLKNKK